MKRSPLNLHTTLCISGYVAAMAIDGTLRSIRALLGLVAFLMASAVIVGVLISAIVSFEKIYTLAGNYISL